MLEFLQNLDPASVGFGCVLAYGCGICVSLMNLIDTRIELNYWMIRLKRAELGLKEPLSLWDRIKKNFGKK